MMDHKRLSIIIVSFNTKNITRQCLQSLNNCEFSFPVEIIVVDNASHDESPEMIEAEFAEVRLLKNSKNNLFSKANNQGATIAEGEYLLLLNSDTIVEPGNIEKLMELAESSDSIGCVGPRVLNIDRTIQSEGRQFDSYRNVISHAFLIHKWPLPISFKRFILPDGFPCGLEGVTRKVGWVSGCCMLVRKKYYHDLGALDEAFPFYHSDNEFCFRLKKHKLTTWVLPRATVIHLGGSSSGQSLTNDIEEYAVSPDQYLFYQRTFGIKHKININRFRILIFGILLPFVKIFSRDMARVVGDKLTYVKKETEYISNSLEPDQ